MPESERTDLTALPDAILLARFAAGDETSFEALFERHYDMVYGVLFRLTGARDEAEDLAQEVFLRLYRQPLRHGENVPGWLYRVAVNAGYNALRAGQRRSRRERIAGMEREASPSAEAAALRNEQQHAVRRALSCLKPREARILILREMGFSYAEIAGICGVAPGSVGQLLARARQAFEVAYGALSAPGEERGED
jgi:RNA polymerase sigma-70 factor (ECF subfamily)